MFLFKVPWRLKMIDLRKYANSELAQTAKHFYKNAINDCAWILYMQEVARRGNGVLEDSYSNSAYEKAFEHAQPLCMAAHMEKYGIDSDSEFLMEDRSDVYRLLTMTLMYATEQNDLNRSVTSKMIADQIHKNMIKIVTPVVQSDIENRYEEYYESGQYARDKAEDDGVHHFYDFGIVGG